MQVDSATLSLAVKRHICRLKCRLWVITGVLDHGLDQKKLRTIVIKYEMIGTVPTDYY